MLAEIHKHINDSRISFDEAEHNYFIDGQKAKFSVTEIIDKFFPEFDSAYWAERKAIEKLNQDHVEYDSEVLQATIKQILEGWEKKRIDAALKGTTLHEKIEDFYNEVTVEYHFFGLDLDKEKIEKAVDLSVTRYCGVMEMFRGFSKVKTEIKYN